MSLGRAYAAAIAEAGLASSMHEVLDRWTPGAVLDTVELLAWKADLHAAEMAAARKGVPT
jgi:hypothetical protein